MTEPECNCPGKESKIGHTMECAVFDGSSGWLGPPSDFGWAKCHGCEGLMDDYANLTHTEDCPKVCMREDCTWHDDEELTMTYETYRTDSTETAAAVEAVYEYRLITVDYSAYGSEVNVAAKDGFVIHSVTPSGNSTSSAWLVVMQREIL